MRIVWGDDEFAVQRRAREIFAGWTAADPGGDAETIDATAGNTDEVMRVLRRLREALNTLPFFGGTKAIWLRGVNFGGEDRVSESQAVLEALTELAKDLAAFRWDGVRLLISAAKLDRRRAFYKAFDKFAGMEHFGGLDPDDRDWQDKAASLASAEFRRLGKRPAGEALSAFVERVGPKARQLASEAEKLSIYVGDRAEVTVEDVEAIVTQSKHARAFALADAVGDRDLPRALRHLEQELWAMQGDRQRSEIGLLYGLISKFRVMLLAREMMAEGLLRPANDYRSFVGQLERVPRDGLPSDKRYNPLETNAYILFRATQQARNYTTEELVAGMGELLRCNRRLVGSGLESRLILQWLITRLVSREAGASPAPRAGRGVRAG